MKTTVYISLALAFSLNQLNAQEKLFFQKGEIVTTIKSCDEFDWCELTDNSGYVKKFWFKKVDKNKYEKIGEGLAYIYTKHFYIDKEIVSNLLLLQEKDETFMKNFDNNYVRLIDIENYKQSLQKEVITNKEIKTKLTEEKEIEKIKVEEPIQKEQTSPYFAYANIGYASFNSNHPKSNDAMLDMGVGYDFNSEYFATLGYQTNIEDSSRLMRGVEINNYYLTFNKRFQNPFSPYLGLIVGYMDMDVYLDKNSSIYIDAQNDESFIYGVQGGFDYPIYKNLFFDGKFQYLKSDLEVNQVILKDSKTLFLGLKVIYP